MPIDRRPLDRRVSGPLPTGPEFQGRPVFFHFTLPQVKAPELLYHLYKEGTHGASCFPGYDGVAKSMREGLYYASLMNRR